MQQLAIELHDDELNQMEPGIQHDTLRGSNLDGEIVNTVIVSLTSAASITAIVNFIASIISTRKSGSVKVNGVELTNVSESLIKDLLKSGGQLNE